MALVIVPKPKAAKDAADVVPQLKSAEKWLKGAAETLRNERFAPIAEQTKQVWEQLRLQSNVSLEDIHLGVMSQGELHSLAISLFIPRATLPENPFRFIVIDDPVQSMDPARVDGQE